MSRKALLLVAVLSATPLAAQEAEPSEEGGFSLMERGARLLFEGLMKEMEPALDEMQDFAQDMGPAMRDFLREMGPALKDLMAEVQDWSVYHPPEMLPNGDIILRRKTPVETAPQPGDEIEL